MNIRTIVSLTLRGVRVGMISLAALHMSVGPALAATAESPEMIKECFDLYPELQPPADAVAR